MKQRRIPAEVAAQLAEHAGDEQALLLQSIALAAALLLLAGFWTPIAGLSIVVIEVGFALSRIDSIESPVLLATIGAALAALGPGSHSVDARLYGRKRIQIRND